MRRMITNENIKDTTVFTINAEDLFRDGIVFDGYVEQVDRNLMYKLYDIFYNDKKTIRLTHIKQWDNVGQEMHEYGDLDAVAFYEWGEDPADPDIFLTFIGDDISSNGHDKTIVFSIEMYEDNISASVKEMAKGKCPQLPSENNLVFDATFVADELVANDIEPGYYHIRLIGDGYNMTDYSFMVNGDLTGITTPFSISPLDDTILSMFLDYNYNTKTLTITLQDTTNTTIQSPTWAHIDLYKIG